MNKLLPRTEAGVCSTWLNLLERMHVELWTDMTTLGIPWLQLQMLRSATKNTRLCRRHV